MIVKDEAEVIERCLSSVKPIIDYWIIVDTGSSDGTQEIIKEFMKDIPGKLYERPSGDFAYNRNEALQLAKEEAEYLLFIDADDILAYEPDFHLPPLNHDCYTITIDYNSVRYSRIQLIRTDLHWEWGGPVHEVVMSYETGAPHLLEGVRMVIIGGGGRSQDPQKYQKDALLLEEDLAQNPQSTRAAFYLAQSYRDAEMPEKALEMYHKRVQMGGWMKKFSFPSTRSA